MLLTLLLAACNLVLRQGAELFGVTEKNGETPMDTSDFYNTALEALEALEKSVPTSAAGDAVVLHAAAIKDLRSFIRAADEERRGTRTRDNYRAHLTEGGKI